MRHKQGLHRHRCVRLWWLCLVSALVCLWWCPGAAHAGTKTWKTQSDWNTGQLDNIRWQEQNKGLGIVTTTPNAITSPNFYVTNYKSNNVVQLDTKTGQINWRFDLAKAGFPDASPSRLVVDGQDNVWVGLRAFSEVIVISRQGKKLATITVGKSPRALALDRDGHVWAGGHGTNEVVKIHKDTYKVLMRVKGVRCPYGATTDAQGNVWFVSRCLDPNRKLVSQATKVDVQQNRVAGVFQVDGAYGVAADRKGQIWISSFEKGCVHRLNLQGKNLGCTPIRGSGRCVTIDSQGNAWIAASHKLSSVPDPYGGTATRLVAKISSDGKFLGNFTNVGLHSIGVAVEKRKDAEFVWVISFAESKVYKLDLQGKLVGVFSSGGDSPYTYSGMTGFESRLQFQKAEGRWRTIVDTKERVSFDHVTWLGQSPQGTAIRVRARSAETRKALASASWGPYVDSKQDLRVSYGRFAEIEIFLQTVDNRVSPRLQEATLVYSVLRPSQQGEGLLDPEQGNNGTPGCGCSAFPASTAGLLVLFLMLLPLWRRWGR